MLPLWPFRRRRPCVLPPTAVGAAVPRRRGGVRPRHQRAPRDRPGGPGPGRRAADLQLGGRTVGTYGVNYPATYDFLNTAAGADRRHQPHRRDGPAVPEHPDRARRLLAGRRGRRHAGGVSRRWATRSARSDRRRRCPAASTATSRPSPYSATRQRNSAIPSRRPAHSRARRSTCAPTVTRSAPTAVTRSPTPATNPRRSSRPGSRFRRGHGSELDRLTADAYCG